MFGSLLGVITDTAKIVAAPLEIAADLTRVVTKPVAELAQEVAKEVKQVSKDITD